MFTIVFLSLHSEAHIKRLVSSIEKKYPIYFDTMDFCKRVRETNKKIYVCD